MRSDWSDHYSDSPTILLSPKSVEPCNKASYHPFNQHLQSFKPFISSPSRNFSQWSSPGSTVPNTMNHSRKRARDESPELTWDSAFSHQWNSSKDLLHEENSTIFRSRNGDSSPLRTKKETKVGDRFRLQTAYGIEGPGFLANSTQDAASRFRRKFQRRNISTGSDAKGTSLKVSHTIMSGSVEPAIDHFTHLLGVGWARIGADQDVQAAARGWSKYIENHYPLSMVSIVLRSKSLEANLAETKDGYFLFKDDLSEGRLVGSDWETCLANLKRTPIVFQGSDTLKAARTTALHPGPSSSSIPTCRIDSNSASLQIETSWLCREDDEMVVG